VSDKKKVSICIPCYNEGENVILIYNALRKEMEKLNQYIYEIVFEDNCSTDNTQSLLKKLALDDKNVKVIINKKNFGAMKNSGYIMFQATGDAIIGMPCDLQTPIELIPQYLELWEKGNEVVLGQIMQSEESKLMFAMRGLYYNIIDKFSPNKELKHVTGCGLFDRKCIDIIETLGEPEPNFRYLVTELGFKVALVPYKQNKREHGKSSYNIGRYFSQALQSFIDTSVFPIKFAIVAGFILSMITFVVGVILLIVKLINWYNIDYGIIPVLLLVCFWGSVQLFFIGIIGQYIQDIITRVKRRPLVLEQERINFDAEE